MDRNALCRYSLAYRTSAWHRTDRTRRPVAPPEPCKPLREVTCRNYSSHRGKTRSHFLSKRFSHGFFVCSSSLVGIHKQQDRGKETVKIEKSNAKSRRVIAAIAIVAVIAIILTVAVTIIIGNQRELTQAASDTCKLNAKTLTVHQDSLLTPSTMRRPAQPRAMRMISPRPPTTSKTTPTTCAISPMSLIPRSRPFSPHRK